MPNLFFDRLCISHNRSTTHMLNPTTFSIPCFCTLLRYMCPDHHHTPNLRPCSIWSKRACTRGCKFVFPNYYPHNLYLHVSQLLLCNACVFARLYGISCIHSNQSIHSTHNSLFVCIELPTTCTRCCNAYTLHCCAWGNSFR